MDGGSQPDGKNCRTEPEHSANNPWQAFDADGTWQLHGHVQCTPGRAWSSVYSLYAGDPSRITRGSALSLSINILDLRWGPQRSQEACCVRRIGKERASVQRSNCRSE